jgi:hypothetical protein
MATEAQFQIFREAYEEENERYGQLESRARLYLGIVTFYLGAIAFKFTDLVAFMKAYAIPPAFYLGGEVLLLGSLLLTILATRIRVYEAPCDLRTIMETPGDTPPTDSDFLDDRLSDYTVATERNRATNNRVANLLSGAAWLLFAAISLQLAVFVKALYQPLP